MTNATTEIINGFCVTTRFPSLSNDADTKAALYRLGKICKNHDIQTECSKKTHNPQNPQKHKICSPPPSARQTLNF